MDEAVTRDVFITASDLKKDWNALVCVCADGDVVTMYLCVRALCGWGVLWCDDSFGRE